MFDLGKLNQPEVEVEEPKKKEPKKVVKKVKKDKK